MLKLLVLTVVLTVSNAFSQSMIVLNNGKVLTIDGFGSLQDLGNFAKTYEIKDICGRYLINAERKVFTVDQAGYFYSKETEDKVAVNLEYKGENYFISNRGKLFSIDNQGMLYETKREKEYKTLIHKGGNFFVSEFRGKGLKKEKALFVINAQGGVIKTDIQPTVLEMINYVGGRFFTNTAGTLFTVSTDGYVYEKVGLGVFKGWEMKKGGNYFIYQQSIYSVSDSGLFQSVGQIKDVNQIAYFGSNFFLGRDGVITTFSDSGVARSFKPDFKLTDISHLSGL